MMNHCRSFVYPEANSFPVIIRGGEEYLNSFQFIWCLHFTDIEVGNLFSDSYFFCPYIVVFPHVFKYSRIQRKGFERKFIFIRTSHFAFLCPGSCQRVCICTFQYIRTDRPDVILVSTCEVDVPFSVQIVKLRCPDMFAHDSFFMFLPDCHFFCIFQSCKRLTSSQYDPVVSRYRCGEIIVSVCVAVNIRVCSLQNPRLIVLKFLTHCLCPPLFSRFILDLYKIFFVCLKFYRIFQKISTIFFSFHCTFFSDSL